MLRPKLLIVFAILFAGMQLFAVSGDKRKNKEWKLARQVNGIEMYYRWITVGDSMKTREMKAEFTINSGIPAILFHFSNPESYMSWAAGIKKCEIKHVNDTAWLTYTVMNYPWPLKQKDLVTHHQIQQTKKETIISIYAAPDKFPEVKGIERMRNYQGKWIFSTIENGSTKVDYRVVSFTKPVFPRFVQDPVVQKLLLASFSDLKLLAEK